MRYDIPKMTALPEEEMLLKLRFLAPDRYATFEDVDQDLPVESRVPMVIGNLDVLRSTLAAMSRQYGNIEMALPKLVLEAEYRSYEGLLCVGIRKETLEIPVGE